jgi:hypothetical protein
MQLRRTINRVLKFTLVNAFIQNDYCLQYYSALMSEGLYNFTHYARLLQNTEYDTNGLGVFLEKQN